MAPTRSVKDMLMVGGHVVLDFINTVDVRNDGCSPDYLNKYGDLLVFAERAGLLDVETVEALRATAGMNAAAAEVALADAVTFREALYRICRAEFSGHQFGEEDLSLFDETVRVAASYRRLTATPKGLTMNWLEPARLNSVVERLAIEALDLLTKRNDRRPIRECPGRNCGWVFLDTSRGGKRRWCSDKTCGTHSRVLKFRAS